MADHGRLMAKGSISEVGTDRSFSPKMGSLQHITAPIILGILATPVDFFLNMLSSPYILVSMTAYVA